MAKRRPEQQRENARRGALKRQCPKCNRKAALSGDGHATDLGDRYRIVEWRSCRWCDFEAVKDVEMMKQSSPNAPGDTDPLTQKEDD